MRRWSVWALAGALMVTALGGLAWAQKDELWVWWCSRGLENASPEALEAAVDELQAAEQIALPALVRQLCGKDDKLCADSGRALTRLLARQKDSGRVVRLLEALADRFAQLSPEGQRQTLLIAVEQVHALGDQAPPKLFAEAARLLPAASIAGDGRRLPAMRLALALLPSVEGEKILVASRTLARGGLKSNRPEERALAVRLAGFAALELLDELPPLAVGATADPSAEVRALATLTLGGRERLLPTEALLPLLHDPDEEVRVVAEQALRSRGLPAAHLRLAKMMGDPDPSVRVRVPLQLLEAPELDTALWLEKLSRDPSPSVRAAALRVAGESEEGQWQDWLRRAAEQDSSPTVKDIASFYRRSKPQR